MSTTRKAPKLADRSDFSYFLTYRSRWSDNDQYGHLNNAVYYHFIDSIINDYLSSHCGIAPNPNSSSHSESSSPIGLVVFSQCTFFSPLSFPQVLEIGLRVTRLGTSSVDYEVGIFAEGTERASAVGGYTHVFVERESRKPVQIMAEELRRGLLKIHVGDPDSSKKGSQSSSQAMTKL